MASEKCAGATLGNLEMEFTFRIHVLRALYTVLGGRGVRTMPRRTTLGPLRKVQGCVFSGAKLRNQTKVFRTEEKLSNAEASSGNSGKTWCSWVTFRISSTLGASPTTFIAPPFFTTLM